MKRMILTPDQLHTLQHSLGCDKHGRGTNGWPHEDENDGHFGYYRNHFTSDPTPDLIALVAAGYMKDHPPREIFGGMHVYTVTREGLTAMKEQSPKPPKLSRAKARYSRYLEYGNCFDSFLEFCRWDSEPERSWNGNR